MEALPVIKCPCFLEKRQTVEWWRPYYNCFFDDILGSTGFELPKTVRVKDSCLGSLKLTLMALTFVIYVVIYGCYVTKAYLSHESIEGVMRMQLQHPVKSHCAPLHDSNCQSDYRSFDKLPYCSQAPENSTTLPTNHRLMCQSVDEFDLDMGAFQAHQVLIPTRVSFIEQQELCKTDLEVCRNRYTNKHDVSRFIGDIERFTLLVDHSFMVDGAEGDMGTGKSAWSMQGFIRPCGPPFDCALVPLETLPKYASNDVTTRKEDVLDFWHAGESVQIEDAYSAPFGDIIRIDYLMRILGISLDSLAHLNFEEHTLRQEGLPIMLEVVYQNFRYYSRPNALPTVYEYRFTPAPFETFKATSVFHVPGEHYRYIHDVHGIYVHARQQGNVGVYCTHHIFLMILEAGLLFSGVRWFITCLSVNRRSYDLEKEMCHTIEFMDSKDAAEQSAPETVRDGAECSPLMSPSR